MADRKVCVVTYTWTSPAEDAESDMDAVLNGSLSPFDFASMTVDSYIEDMTDQEAVDNVVFLFGEGDPFASEPDGPAA